MKPDHWFFRYKLHHLPFWFGYHYLWWTLRIGSLVGVAWSLTHPPAAAKFFFYMVLQMIGVYFNLYFLVPRFLEKGRYTLYVGLLISTIIVTAIAITASYHLTAFILGSSTQDLYGVDPANWFFLFESGPLPSTAAAMTLAMSIKLTRNWIRARRREELLEKEKLETELKFLKAQINPHFLFNTINSIFVLINKDPKMASESLAKFSDLLRYQLYDCNENQILLTQELEYLNNFIELEKLRQDGALKSKFNIQVPTDKGLTIAPFILMPFIENAFKHVSHKKNENWIEMELRCRNDQLLLTVSNSRMIVQTTAPEPASNKGIGLKNVQRRLALVYPSMHELAIRENEDEFLVELTLDLADRKTLNNKKAEPVS